MKRTALSLLLLTSVLAGSAVADVKIAIVDVQRAIEESNGGKAALAKLKADMEAKQKELSTKQNELAKADAELTKQAQAGTLKPEALQAKRQELMGKLQQLQETFARLQKDLSEKEQKATQPLVEKASQAITFLAQRDKYTLVLRKEVVLWPNQSELDITNEVIRKINELK